MCFSGEAWWGSCFSMFQPVFGWGSLSTRWFGVHVGPSTPGSFKDAPRPNRTNEVLYMSICPCDDAQCRSDVWNNFASNLFFFLLENWKTYHIDKVCSIPTTFLDNASPFMVCFTSARVWHFSAKWELGTSFPNWWILVVYPWNSYGIPTVRLRIFAHRRQDTHM